VRLVLVVLCCLAGLADARPRKPRGKVVRVERNQPVIASKARLCTVYDAELATCSREVSVGEVGLVIDGDGNYGEATVLHSSRVADACGNTVTWTLTLDGTRLSSRDLNYNAVFVLDHRVADNGHTMAASMNTPSGRADEPVQHVIDDDGDNQPDLLITTYGCDERARPTRNQVTHTCFDTWLEVRDKWHRARVDQVPTCYR
jgi:hypothetical protein